MDGKTTSEQILSYHSPHKSKARAPSPYSKVRRITKYRMCGRSFEHEANRSGWTPLHYAAVRKKSLDGPLPRPDGRRVVTDGPFEVVQNVERLPRLRRMPERLLALDRPQDLLPGLVVTPELDELDDILSFRIRIGDETKAIHSAYVFIGIEASGDGTLDAFVSSGTSDTSLWDAGTDANTSPSTTAVSVCSST